MEVLNRIKWDEVASHYQERVSISRRLSSLLMGGNVRDYARLAVSESNDDFLANYSAQEHHLGPKILNQNPDAHRRVFELARNFNLVAGAHEVPLLIKRAGLKYLAISVGSEISCMIKPRLCWIANTRTIWAHLLIKHSFNIARANEELRLYRDGEDTSEMAYQKWRAIHAAMNDDLQKLNDLTAPVAEKAGFRPGLEKYLWIDSIANHIYAAEHG
ncbi:hypothetical protein RHAB21_02311 [Pseudorhizobium halotolerans]|uniref:Uncharacterized protein n=1 Tax=Pseudorhizobium halotolerans TaxID=1233081 RepID=A0ABM8PKF7_9HYPH|nr:hypothetical protein [Pseudorhizobium halotolerans]CAD7034836.1 hypothetical protein RHAB21_02311 [Pseudorhizobium halotolerans]